MQINALRAAAAAASLCAMGAISAMPQTPGSNVVVSQCDPQPYNNIVESNFTATPYKSGHRAILAMEYRNQAPTAATAVVFGLVSGGKLVGVGEDDGTFSRGAVVAHQVMLGQTVFPLRAPAHCVVLRVRYANGTAWYNPDPPTF